MNLIITGAKGQLGSELTLLARQAGLEVRAYSSQEWDITNPAAAPDLSDTDFLINCAAYTAVDRAEDEPEKAFAINSQAVAHLAKLCKAHDVPLIHISTDYVFDGVQKQAYQETDFPHPLSVYGASKLQGEESLRAIWDKHIILRISWVFSRFGTNFVKTILRLSKERPELKIVADQHGAPTAAAHVAQVILNLIRHPALTSNWGLYHYTDQPLTTWCDFARSFINPEQCKILPISTAEYPTKAKRPQNSALNCEKIKQVFGITQQPWQEALTEIVTP